MSLDLNSVRSSATGIAHLLAYEPAVRANFRDADLTTTLSAIVAVLSRKPMSERAICAYFADRELPYGEETLSFLLRSYEGYDRERHLWIRDEAGIYSVPIRKR